MRGDDNSMDGATVRNLDEIQETDPSARPGRLGALVLASLGGACIVFAAVALVRTPQHARPQPVDPLGELVAHARAAGADAPGEPLNHDVTFPALLSDAKRPTTSFESMRDPKAPPLPAGAAAGQALGAPPATSPANFDTTGPELDPGVANAAMADKLPSMPMPAQHVLQRGRSTAAPGDTLSALAMHVARDEGAETSAAGMPGGFQLQVSSFKTQPEADAFAAALRRRGHKAYVEPAEVKGRGTWYRVKIGPFKYKHAAVIYRQDFEAKERLVTFIVDPPKKDVETHVQIKDDE